MYVAHSREDGEYQPLLDHLEETAALTAAFADDFHAAEWGKAIGLLHDIGKTRDAVQQRIKGKGAKADHSTAGACAVVNHCGMLGAYCIAGHHGRLPDGGSKDDMRDQATLYARLKRTDLPNDPSVIPEMPKVDRASLPLSTPSLSAFRVAFFIRMLSSCLIDADRLDTEKFASFGKVQRGGYDALDVLHKRLFAFFGEKFGEPRNAIDEKRTEIRHACVRAAEKAPGLFSLTVPTGGGKTLSSIAFALEHAKQHGLKRVIYVIPYVSIIEQNADVFRDALGKHNVVEHHANFAFQDEDGDVDEWQVRQRLSTENWDAPVVVTTTVQFFESLFAARTSQLRKLHNIAKSVILFDEAQMIPSPYLIPCVEAIAELVRNYHCTAVLMSATQPALGPYLPEDMLPREMMPDPEGLYMRFFSAPPCGAKGKSNLMI